MDSGDLSQRSPAKSSKASEAEPVTPAPSHAALSGGLGLTGILNRSSSLSPPQSSQVKQRSQTSTPTLSVSHLSSPPPTTEAVAPATKTTNTSTSLSTAKVQEASAEELRIMVTDLMSELQETKTATAHYKLQYQMLSMESAEAAERMAVEMDMAQRELDVLQTSDHRREEQQPTPPQPEHDPSVRTVHIDLYNAMVQEIRELKSQNTYFDSVNASQKKMLLQQESEIATLNDRVLLMRDRIRESRDHLTRSRRIGGMPDSTPRTEQSTPFQTPRRERMNVAPNSQEQPGFAALLQATDLMSQGRASATPTPRQRNPSGQGKGGRAVPTIPTTPQRVQTKPPHAMYYTPQQQRPQQAQAPNTAPPPRKHNMYDPVRIAQEDREQESDGTVSATDDSEAETEVPDGEADVGQSHPSQLASELLRSPTAGRGRDGPGGRSMVQGRIFGHVTKPSGSRSDDTRGVKRARTNSVGLGIAGVKGTELHLPSGTNWPSG